MDVILKQAVINLGEKHDVVSVKPGYARNYLIPQGIALPATDSNRRAVEELKKQAAHKQAFMKQQAESLAEKLGALTIEIETLAGSDGKLFGSVTNLQIAARLAEKGFDIDRRTITVDDIHEIGEYKAVVHLHRDVKATVPLVVKHKEKEA
ncbi:MAG: 50S ribosomal protein L9 [Bacteroidia bacterium]